ncbi:MAG TPA: hypothetical protein VI933_04550 [archaeon]|nr:hypothetical protein [archaeon]
MKDSKSVFLIGLIFILFVSGCAAKLPAGTTTTAAPANVTTTTLPPTTTTIPGPEKIADGVSAFLISNSTIYYLSETEAKLYKYAKGSQPTELASGIGIKTRNILDDGDYLYFTHEVGGAAKFSRVPKAGGQLEEKFSCSPGNLANLFSDDTYIYVLPTTGTFCRLLKTTFASDGNFRLGVAGAGENLVYDSKNVFFPDTQWIKKVPRIGKIEVGVLVSEVVKSNLLLDGTSIYWINKNNELYKVGTDGKGKVLIAQKIDSKYIAQDTASIYFIENSDNSIKKIVKAGGAPVTLGKLSGPASKIEVDTENIYWLQEGSLMKKRK